MTIDDETRSAMGFWGPLLAPKVSAPKVENRPRCDVPDGRFKRRIHSPDIPRGVCVVCKEKPVYRTPSQVGYKCWDCLKEYNKKKYHERKAAALEELKNVRRRK